MAERVKQARSKAKAKAKGRPADGVKDEPVKRPRGRPQLPPSEVVNTRMPLALIDRMNRFVDHERLWSDGVARNRAQLVRMAVDRFLAERGY